MTYFVTGATGFIGRFLVQALLQRGKGTIYVLVRPKSLGKLDELHEFWGKDSLKRVVPVKGDLAQPKLGVGKADLRGSRARSSISIISAPCTTSRPAPRRWKRRTSPAPRARSNSRRPSTPVASTS